ncbi:hypothetical protein EFK50_00970 [Nocardioides marmoriginsengisoli]|uniref:Uncharacterized protein n=1 Tax=Nocardioides marmoriginsengisoli TaxID=661483 RepID=A0A3N0CRZ1_9ACTN|nr:hypothetical protein [Nocardioides marmoriginsengisoli]RNL66228.1 hypothetical protein EFK50_00970 [Nocardioides marmoriginsengisoli]
MSTCSPEDDNYFTKDPDSKLDYLANWAGTGPKGPWLKDGDTIATSEWIVPAGLTKTDEANTDTTATIWLSGGTLGQSYEVVNRITTAQGRGEDQTLHFDIIEH